MQKKILPLTLFSLAVILAGHPLYSYRVVLDPGHGGRDIVPHTAYGDKYDRRLDMYLDKFREGARHRGVWEFEVMYDIAARAKALLDLTQNEEGRPKFAKILAKYGKAPTNLPAIEAYLSRPAGYIENYFENRDDVNAPFRLYDYPDQKTGEIRPGTISRINALEPELVITLHLTHTEAPASGAMATVITPGYRTYELAQRYVRSGSAGRQKIRSQFAKTAWNRWFISDDRYKVFPSFMADAFIYYIGFWSKPDGVGTDFTRFRGYRHNLVQWAYADSDSIVESLYGKQGERYATSLAAFEPLGPFWEREKGEAENWRREGGPEGYGGDNHYAGMEVLRYTRKAFVVNGFDTVATAPKILHPYMSTWAVPTYVNAIAAFVELAHTTSKRDHLRMAKHRQIYAEAIAVSAYSLLYGLEQKSAKSFPKGEPLNLARYQKLAGGNYFRRAKTK
ncbi:MAG TPA: hypothetical protein PKM44_07935 [Turneriella sp.]|nr:hypothetical protein [Turneriella sp.]HNJ65042.1 hypothetical protein [Turneriella sp.]HNL10426.1 hypothetical protein [Turneriella sp.]HNL54632.1 hypothetical protein [Turneriella sp.]